MNLFESAIYYQSLRYRVRIVCMLVAAVCFGIAMASWTWFGAAIAVAFSEIFRD